MIETTNSLTAVYHKVKEGDEEAATELWQACSCAMLSFADRHLRGVPQKMAGREDIAQEAFASFIKAARLGRFPDFKDRNDLWRLLFKITRDKAIDLRRYENRRKTTNGFDFDAAIPETTGVVEPVNVSESAFDADIVETLEYHLGLLYPSLRQYAVARLEGYSNGEIAEEFGVALRTVERKLQMIRTTWMKHLREGAA